MSDGRDREAVGELPLAGVRVLEIAELEFAQYAGRLLANLGARVTKVERGDGDPLRRRPPLAAGTDGGQHSVPFEFYNAGKRSVHLWPVRCSDPVGALRGIAATHDVIVADTRQRDVLRAIAEQSPAHQLRVCAGVLGGGPDAPNQPSTPLTRFHSSTTGWMVPAEKDTSVRPSWSGPDVFEVMHGVGVALAILGERGSGAGGDIEYSQQSYGIWLDKMMFPRASTTSTLLDRRSNAYPFGGNLRCADGYVAIFVIEDHQWVNMCHLIGRPEWGSDERFADGRLRVQHAGVIDAELSSWCGQHTVREVVSSCRQHDVPCGWVRDLQSVVAHEAFAERGAVASSETVFGPLSLLRLPFGPAYPQRNLGRAPALGEHNAEVFAEAGIDSPDLLEEAR